MFQQLTTGLNHDGKISGYRRLDSKGQSHDRKSYGPTPLRGGPCNQGPKDHGHWKQVPVLEVAEEVVLDGKTPPMKIIKFTLFNYWMMTFKSELFIIPSP